MSIAASETLSDNVLAHVVESRFGISPDSQRKNRERGIWLEGVVWFRAPNGRIFYSPKAINEWIVSEYKKLKSA